MPVSHRRFNLKKINEYLEKVQAIRDEQQQKITENTDMKKFKIPDAVKEASKKYDFVSKAKPNK